MAGFGPRASGDRSSEGVSLAPTRLNSQEFGLPRFSFNQDCLLHSVNQAARDLLGPSSGLAGEAINGLFPSRSHRPAAPDGPPPAKDDPSVLVARWTELAAKCQTKSWGEGVVVEYNLVGLAVPRRAEATVVQHPPTDSLPNGFSVLLTRQLPNLMPEFENLKFDVPPSDAELDQSTIEYAVAGLSRGLMSGTRDEGASLASVDAEGMGTKVLSMAELVQLVDEFPQICFTSRPDGFVDWMNKQWYEYTGLPEGVPIATETWVSFFHKEDLPIALAAWHQGLSNLESFEFEYRVKSRHGEWRWKLAQGRPMRDAESGDVKSWACTITDVDDKVRATEAANAARLEAERTNERMRSVLSSASVLLLCVDLDARLTFSEGSSAVAISLGALLADSSIGKPLAEVWPDTKLQDSVRLMLEPDTPANLSFRTDMVSPGGTKHFQYRLSALTYGSTEPGDTGLKQGLIIVASDITHVIATEAALEKSKTDQAQLVASETAAREASKLKDMFMQTLSHEIRTPISTVSAICELLLGDANLSAEQRNLIGQALRSANILLDLVGLVLDLRKVETGALTLEENPFTIQDVVEDCRLFEVPCKAKGVEFVVQMDPDLWPANVLGDRLRLRQILTNGLANAVKFSHEGRIVLRVNQSSQTAHSIGLTFEVIDQGIGIKPSELRTLFKPFQQANAATAREYGGTGLGLTIARNLAELMGGTVELTSVAGQGTTMTIKVNLRTEEPGPAADQATDDGAREGPARRPQDFSILLAEDNEVLRQVYSKTLGRMGFQVGTAGDGHAAVAAIRTKQFQLCLMDQQMPGMDGLEATHVIRSDLDLEVSRTVIISLTAGVIGGNRERCLEAGCDSYLAKPVRATDLEAAIWEQLDAAAARYGRPAPSPPKPLPPSVSIPASTRAADGVAAAGASHASSVKPSAPTFTAHNLSTDPSPTYTIGTK